MTDDQIFEKKQECAGLKDEIIKEQKIDEEYWSQKLLQIFYSKEKNSCLYELASSYELVSWSECWERWAEKVVYDYFSNDIVIQKQWCKDVENYTTEVVPYKSEQITWYASQKDYKEEFESYEKKLKELKGE